MSNLKDALRGLQPIQLNVEPSTGQLVRPLGQFSDFICQDLGTRNEKIRLGKLHPDRLFGEVEVLVASVPERAFGEFTNPGNVRGRRDALVDLVWAVRSLDIAYQDSPEWKVRRDGSVLFQRTRVLSDMEERNPNLAWSDISLHHPLEDPRTFLPRGENRDQEVLLYRTQAGIDKVFKAVTEVGASSNVSSGDVEAMAGNIKATVDAVVYLSQVRNPGQFYQLDPFLGANNEYVGHGTGAFSAWSYTVGYFLSVSGEYTKRLLNGANRKAYDRDSHPYIDQIEKGEFRTLEEIVKESSDPNLPKFAEVASNAFALFLRAHRGAIKRHAPRSFDDAAPADLSKDNDQSIHDAIVVMRDGRPTHPYHPETRLGT